MMTTEKNNEFMTVSERLHRLAAQDFDSEDFTKLFMAYNGYRNVLQAQGLLDAEVNHTLKWKVGDKFIKNVNSFVFGENPSESEYNTARSAKLLEDFGLRNEKGMFGSFCELVTNELLLSSMIIIMLCVFLKRRDKYSAVLVLALMGGYIVMMVNKPDKDENEFIQMLDFWNLMEGKLHDCDLTAEVSENEIIYNPQSFDEDVDVIVEFIVFMLSASVGYKAKEPLTKFMGSFVRFSDRTKETMSSTMLKVSSKLSMFFTDIVKCDHLAKYFYVDIITDVSVKKLLDQINEFITNGNAGLAFYENYHNEIYDNLMDETNRILNRIDKKSFDYRVLSNAFLELQKQTLVFKSLSKSLSGDRIQPVGVLFRGPPGIMKTVLLDRINRLVTRYTIPEVWKAEFEENPQAFIYPLPVDKWYDGYTYKAWLTVADDLFQKREVAGDSNLESVKVIQLINTAPFNLPMADVSTKNSKFFRSAFVVGTTNLMNFSLLQGVHDVEAVARRFGITVDVSINKKYLTADGKLNFEELPQLHMYIGESEDMFSSTSIPNDFWDFRLFRWKANVHTDCGNITFLQLVETIVEAYQTHVKDYYVNEYTTENAYEQISNELDKKFKKANRYGSWFAKNKAQEVLKPQSGLEDLSYKANPNLFRDGLNDIPGHFSCLPQTQPDSDTSSMGYSTGSVASDVQHFITFEKASDRRDFFDRYYDFCNELGRMDLYSKSVDKIEAHLDGLSQSKRAEIIRFLSESQDKFFIALFESYVFFLSKNVNPVTFEERIDREGLKAHVLLLKEKILGFFSGVYRFCRENFLPLIVAGGAIGGFVYFIYKGIKSLITPYAQSVDLDRVAGKGVRRNVGKHIRLSQRVGSIKVASQGVVIDGVTLDSLPFLKADDFGGRSGTNDIISKIHNKYFFIVYVVRVKDGEIEYVRLGHCFNLQGQYFVMPFHFIYQCNTMMRRDTYQGAEIMLITPLKTACYRITMEDFVLNFETTEESADNDMCIVHVPAAQLNSVGVMKYLLTNRDIDVLKRCTAMDITLMGSCKTDPKINGLFLRTCNTKAKFEKSQQLVHATWETPDSVYGLDETVSYRSNFGAGDCGSLIFTSDGNFQNRVLLGMHVAGDPKCGFATVMRYEVLKGMLDEIGAKDDSFLDEEEPDYVVPDIIDPQGNLVSTAYMQEGYAPSHISKSEIVRSKFYGLLPPPYDVVTTLPTKLFPFKDLNGDRVDPFSLALENYGHMPGCIPLEFVYKASQSYKDLIHNKTMGYKRERKVLSVCEALHSYYNLNSISSATSAGFPMNLNKFENLKEQYFKAWNSGDEKKISFYFERIASAVQDIIEKYLNRLRPFFLYNDCLKDERRAKEKVMAGLTRLFSGSPFLMLVLFRMYFGSFFDCFVEYGIDVGSAIGLNPYSEDWDVVARKLTKFGRTKGILPVGAGDYAKFDGRQQPVIMNEILFIIQDWYGKTATHNDYIIRKYLWSEVTCSKHVLNGRFYEWMRSLPSGNPLTALINTMYNNLVFRVSFQFAGCDIENFNTSVYVIALGDDVLFGLAPYLHDSFNELTLPGFMLKCGMVYTTEVKDTAVVPFRDITEVEFLKRSFRFSNIVGRWIAPLRFDVIIDMLNWTKRKKSSLLSDQITVDNIGVVLREISLHSKDKYDYWYPILKSLWMEHYPEIESTTPMYSDHLLMFQRTLDNDFQF
jgi:hypothetical protein